MQWFLRVKRRDGLVFGLTDGDLTVEFGGLSYLACPSFTAQDLCRTGDLAVDNIDLATMFASDLIERADIEAGLFDFAEIELFMLDESEHKHILQTGWLGEVEIIDGQVSVELRGLTQKFVHHIGDLYSPACRANFGDENCGVDKSKLTHKGIIEEVINDSEFLDHTLDSNARFYNNGEVFLPRINCTMEVRFCAQNVISLVLPLVKPLLAGDEYVLTAGCDKNFETCVGRYENAINFRGEPHVPA